MDKRINICNYKIVGQSLKKTDGRIRPHTGIHRLNICICMSKRREKSIISRAHFCSSLACNLQYKVPGQMQNAVIHMHLAIN